MQTITAVDEVVFRFGSFELFPARRRLSKAGLALQVGSRGLDLLVTLVERAGHVVAKDELILRVWPNVVVEETNLRVNVYKLRRVLGDDGLDERYIMYVARRGYMFVAPLEYGWRPAARFEAFAPVHETRA